MVGKFAIKDGVEDCGVSVVFVCVVDASLDRFDLYEDCLELKSEILIGAR